MVQSEVADRLAAPPGSRTYGVPSVKAAWYAAVARQGSVGRTVFWPAPNVDSGLVSLVRREPPPCHSSRREVFAVIDAAFAQRRKTIRAALRAIAPAERVGAALETAGVEPTARGEQLDVATFARIADALDLTGLTAATPGCPTRRQMSLDGGPDTAKWDLNGDGCTASDCYLPETRYPRADPAGSGFTQPAVTGRVGVDAAGAPSTATRDANSLSLYKAMWGKARSRKWTYS